MSGSVRVLLRFWRCWSVPITIGLLLIVFVIGGFLGLKKQPPITTIVNALRTIERVVMAVRLDTTAYRKWAFDRYVQDGEWIDKIHPSLRETDVDALIDIDSPVDAERKRGQLIDFIWRGQGMPMDRMPDAVALGIKDSDFDDLPNLARIDRLTVSMAHGVTSNIYLFRPQNHNGQFVIYYQGHYGHFKLGKNVIRAFLEKGFGVVGMSMPMLGPNTGPNPYIPRFGHITTLKHNRFIFFESQTFYPLRYFIDPMVIVVNYISREQPACPIALGVSTGGWLVTLVAALDTRICRTYPVAGSLPAYVRMAPPNVPNIGDYEEMRPELLAIANVLEIYVLAATGGDRAHIMIYNQFDDCCYRGIGARTFKEPVRRAVVRAGGGEVDVYIDSTHIGHLMSPHTIEYILRDLERVQQQEKSEALVTSQ